MCLLVWLAPGGIVWNGGQSPFWLSRSGPMASVLAKRKSVGSKDQFPTAPPPRPPPPAPPPVATWLGAAGCGERAQTTTGENKPAA